jgi:hypothetical protein
MKVAFVIARNEVTKQSIAETAWRRVASAYGLAITEGQEG